MALEPIISRSAVSSDTVQTGKNVSAQLTQQQDSNTNTQLSEISQAPNLAVVFDSQNNNLTEGEQSKSDNNQQWIKNTITDTNNKIKPTKTRCEFSYNEAVNRVAIKVLDSETDEVIREIPPEETLKVLEKIWEIAGLVVDERR